MLAEVGRPPLGAARSHVPFHNRIYGLGSPFGKAVRDGRGGIVVVAGLIASVLLLGGRTMATTYGTVQARAELASYAASLPPVMRGIYGNPLGVDTLGGFVAWHYAGLFSLMAGLWAILSLSSALAGEARRGSLDFIVAAPLSRRHIAIQKVAAFGLCLTLAMAIVALAAWLAGVVDYTLPGDSIAPQNALAYAAWLGMVTLLAGSVAFALGPFVGRGSAAGIAGALLFGGYVVHGYRASVPAFDAVDRLTWFSWTSNHLPLIGRFDWPAIVLVAVVAIALLAIGVEGFARRDIGITAVIRGPGLPRALLGVRGPLRRAFGEQLPLGLAWGIGIGLYGFVIASASRSFADEMRRLPDLLRLIDTFFPDADVLSPGGFLQVMFAEFAFVLVGLAAATLVGGWASDENSGRLELLLATPLSRARWAVSSAIGADLAAVAGAVVLAGAIGLGAAAAGGEAVTPMIGSAAAGVFALAVMGVGFAFGGVVGTRHAALAAATFAVVTFLLDTLAPALDLPDWVHQLAVSAHLGKPLVGTWDAVGIALCAALAVGGVLAGAWGIRRRDIAR